MKLFLHPQWYCLCLLYGVSFFWLFVYFSYLTVSTTVHAVFFRCVSWCCCDLWCLFLWSELSEAAYEKLADETLDALADYFEDLTDEAFTGPEYDVIFSVSVSLSGIVILTCGGLKASHLRRRHQVLHHSSSYFYILIMSSAKNCKFCVLHYINLFSVKPHIHAAEVRQVKSDFSPIPGF